MTKITIFGKGNMGKAIGENFLAGKNQVDYIGHDDIVKDLGDVIVLAVPYPAAIDIVEKNATEFAGKVIVDITNPLNFDNWDELVVPADSSAAAQISAKLPNSKVIKAFNTNFAATLNSKKVGTKLPTTVLVAGNDQQSKQTLIEALSGSGLQLVDAGSLKRAREMEAVGFLQMTLAAKEKISWTGGFGLIK
ncbi:MAG: NADPH-dependent F420 reductase [Liquorilactobacillus nagelii]|jgi:predicted dinucleotide-binding enzyme|uniref:Diguanylate cyclase n=2 Tax=Liquorilactobacillus nagelii TaxID=82688 RepID=A0A3S6QTZ1_9LACO|nr:NADPH-dependent F420 reductase [Liquorilactobacillus nagelii]AUJ31544.1 diguanylate cyclase [Liquorilactobacillus nagelii]MCC7616097.1 diguanylate cyclase [Liquorilactobacillus nagelii]MCI1633259.1 NADPH-dependent F420 reductase [Liquorilactobacillus nagelii]MCI1699664.1 NADPH-dependent F420 reductase [Liquorilactobacillus nagelii]MCI1921772.1 NADPH-dependent F420 reductase [Liquorilactobacillus nagelii]